ncbi:MULTISPECIES: ribonuclease Y [Caldisericum]|uniref:ribonuclease Y n=1 Tax=Caldisericum TaxID=693074 RepID=UPI003C7887DC
MSVPYFLYVLVTILMFAIGALVGWVIQGYIYKSKIGSVDEYLKKKQEENEKKLEVQERELKIRSKEELEKKIQELESKYKERQKELQEIENRLLKKEEIVDRRAQFLDKKEKDLLRKEEDLIALNKQIEEKSKSLETELFKIASLTREEARQIILREVEEGLKKDIARKIAEAEEEIRATAKEKAKVILSQAMESCAIDYVAETTVSVVPLPSDELKGRIIGREGRNIRTFETLTGVDLLIDDTPEAVTLSCFDPIRREIARRALEKLIIDGRIHPARIEEFVSEAEVQFEESLIKDAEDALMSISLYGFPNELKKIIGEMKYRTSYGQNLLKHSLEVATIAGIIAQEIGENVILAKRAGFLHDIGKVISQEYEGPHALTGGELLRKFGENEAVIHAVQSHHGDIKQETALDVIVQVADTLSATRPGARREDLENYIKRMEELERIASSVHGVKKAFVVQAGREVRILVNPEEVDEETSQKIAKDVARTIEESLVYPGIIKVTVVREIRYVEYAK